MPAVSTTLRRSRRSSNASTDCHPATTCANTADDERALPYLKLLEEAAVGREKTQHGETAAHF